MTLKFSAASHRYWLSGKPIPGVTTILSKGLPKPALPYWSARCVAEFVVDNPEGLDALLAMGRGPAVAALKEVPWKQRDEAAVRGTDVHHLADQVIHGTAVEVPAHIQGHVDGYVRWLDAFDVQPILTETAVAHRTHWWAGTLDAVVTFGRGPWAGMTVLADWKTSRAVYGETGLQTGAYASAEFAAPTPDEESPLPLIEATGVLHITEDGSQFYPLASTPAEIADAYRVFRHISFVAAKTDWIKGLIGEPMRDPGEEAA